MLFENSTSDAVLIYNCCEAAVETITSGQNGTVTEQIAACDKGKTTPGPGLKSFSNISSTLFQTTTPAVQIFFHTCLDRFRSDFTE